MREKTGMVSSLDGDGKDIGPLPLDCIWSVLVGLKGEEGRSVAVVEAVVAVVYSEGVYLDESSRCIGIGSKDGMDGGIVKSSFGVSDIWRGD
jgi:hypothetical protein